MEFSIPILTVLAVGIVAGVVDVMRFKVYNWLTFPLLLGGLIYHAFSGGWDGLAASAIGTLVAFGTLIIPYAMGGIGAGDVKLMAAVGAWLGLPLTVYVLAGAIIAAGVYGVVLMIISGRARQSLLSLGIMYYQLRSVAMHLGSEERVEEVVKRDDRRTRLIPFAAMVPIGVVVGLVLKRHLYFW